VHVGDKAVVYSSKVANTLCECVGTLAAEEFTPRCEDGFRNEWRLESFSGSVDRFVEDIVEEKKEEEDVAEKAQHLAVGVDLACVVEAGGGVFGELRVTSCADVEFGCFVVGDTVLVFVGVLTWRAEDGEA